MFFRIVIRVIIALIIIMYILVSKIYKEMFLTRSYSYEPKILRLEDFPGLERERYQFPSNRGQILTGYLYHNATYQLEHSQPKSETAINPKTAWQGLLVIAHGYGGGGHQSYLELTDYFAGQGFLVFAYDATGNDESEGQGVGCLPQGVIDLDYAISFVEQLDIAQGLPLFLFGHSWGAYSVCTVLSYHPEVKAVIACSGFNDSQAMLLADGQKRFGPLMYFFFPYVRYQEEKRSGSYAGKSSLDGFAASNTSVMLVQGGKDDLVPAQFGYDLFYDAYKNDPRFEFVFLAERAHNYIYCDQSYLKEFDQAYEAWRKSLAYNPKCRRNKARFEADKAAYIIRHLDRKRWANKLDTELCERFSKFLKKHR